MMLGLWKQLEFGAIKADNLPYSKNYLGGLHDISEIKLGEKIPVISLWLAVLIDAAKYRDKVFLRTYGSLICEFARLNRETVFEMFENIWELEDKHDSQ